MTRRHVKLVGRKNDLYFTWPLITTLVLLKVIDKVHKPVNDISVCTILALSEPSPLYGLINFFMDDRSLYGDPVISPSPCM